MTRAFLSAVLLLLACAGEPEVARRESVFWRYMDAVNANDVDLALSQHSSDPEFQIPGQRPVTGSEAVRALLQWDSVLGSEIRFEPAQWLGDTLVVGAGVERSAWFAGVGIDSLRYTPGTRFVFEGDLIKGIYPSSLQAESAQEFEAKVTAFLAWAQENAPMVSQLAPGGQFIYDGSSAQRWLEVLERYRREAPGEP